MTQVATVMYLKTTGEGCFVLRIDPHEDTPGYQITLGEKVTVRRPVESINNGLTHVVETYFEAELMTLDEKIKFDIEARKKSQDAFFEAAKQTAMQGAKFGTAEPTDNVN